MAIKLINDPIHGNIYFSRIEAKILSSQLFNRLHSIEQNSLAYTVYPSMRTSRFMHSLGVMHVSSQLFINAINNSNSKNRDNFALWCSHYLSRKIDSLSESLYDSNILSNNKRVEVLQLLDDMDKNNIIKNNNKEMIGEYFSNIFQLSKLPEDKATACLFILQVIRIAGLLHDIGHLPGSHLGEFAIELFIDTLKSKQKNKDSLEHIIISDYDKKIGRQNTQPHELIGYRTQKILFSNLIRPYTKSIITESDAEKIVFLTLCSEVLNDLESANDQLIDDSDKNNVKIQDLKNLNSIYKLINSSFDADRLDFILRDGITSGLLKYSGDLDRIVKQYNLISLNDCEDEIEYFRFLPSIQSLSEIQEFLIDRLRIYKYIVSHHKVKRMDHMLQQSIYFLLMSELNDISNIEDSTEMKKSINNKYIRQKKFKPKVDSTLGMIATIFADDDIFSMRLCQLTDDWLMGLLKSKYSDIKHKSLQKNSKPIDKYSKSLVEILDEIFTFSKGFKSLWKRNHNYLECLKNCHNELYKENNNYLKNVIDNLCNEKGIPKNITFEKCIRNCKQILSEKKEKHYYILHYLAKEPFINQKGKFAANSLHEKLIEKIECDKWDIMLAPITIKTGIDNEELLLSDLTNSSKYYKINKVSEVCNYLESKVNSTPPFIAYYNPKSLKNMNIIYKSLGHAIIECIQNNSDRS